MSSMSCGNKVDAQTRIDEMSVLARSCLDVLLMEHLRKSKSNYVEKLDYGICVIEIFQRHASKGLVYEFANVVKSP